MSHAEEFADLCSVHNPRARKAHQCTACSETIEAGQTYARYGIVHDGTAATVKHCNRCRAIFLALCTQDPREPIDMSLDCGETWDDVFGPCPDDVQALAFMLPGESLGGPE